MYFILILCDKHVQWIHIIGKYTCEKFNLRMNPISRIIFNIQNITEQKAS